MKSFLEEYGMFVVYFIIALFLVVAIGGFTYQYTDLHAQTPKMKNVSAGNNRTLAERGLPILVVESSSIKKGSAFKPLDYVKQATDSAGNDIKNNIEVDGKVDVNKKGVYLVTYTATDSAGLFSRVEATFLVD